MNSELRNGTFFIERGVTGHFSFSGPDHLRYLHNRLTQDIKSLVPGRGARSLCLSPNGRVQGELFILKDENSIDVFTGEVPSAEFLSEIKTSILQFKVADQLECGDLSANVTRLTLVGSGLSSLAMMLGINLSEKSKFSHFSKEFDGANLKIITNSILGFDSLEVVGPKEANDQLKQMGAIFGVQQLDSQFAEKLRVFSKSWKYGVDVDEKTLAAEIGLEELVSFKKGCYPGQEVVEMSISRGRPNRSLELVSVSGELSNGAEIQVADKVVGVVTSSVFISEENQSYFLSRLKTEFVSSPDLSVEGRNCKIVSEDESRAKFA